MVCSAAPLNVSCVPTIAFSLIRYSVPFKRFLESDLNSVDLPSSAKPAITRWRIWWNCGLQEARNISRVIPFSSICLPVMPLLQSARKIHEMFVYISPLSIEFRPLNRSMMFLSISKFIDFLESAKCTSAKVLLILTDKSQFLSIESSITRSMTPLASSSSNSFSW